MGKQPQKRKPSSSLRVLRRKESIVSNAIHIFKIEMCKFPLKFATRKSSR